MKNTTNTKETTKTTKGMGTTSETIGVPRNYIVGTLCRDAQAANAFGEPLFGTAGDSTLCVSKGLFLYTIAREGEYAIATYLPVNAKVGCGEVCDIPMGFLPTALSNLWMAIVQRTLSAGKTVSVNDVLSMWRNFILSTIPADGSTYGPGFIGTTRKMGSDVSRGLLLYTLYREGEIAVHGGFTASGTKNLPQTITVGMGFLPKDLCQRWQSVVAQLFAANPSTTEHDVMMAWKNFVTATIGNNVQHYIEQYSTIMPNVVRA